MFSWISKLFQPTPSALPQMGLGPDGRADNPLMLQFFTWDALCNDVSWWKHLESELPRLANMGFTQVWIPPPNKAERPEGRGYDAYDLWDLGEFNQKGTTRTRWGTKQELIQACNVAQRVGIHIIIDAVLNHLEVDDPKHKMGADRTEIVPAIPVDPQNRLKEVGPTREIEAWTAFDFRGRGDEYSALRWNQEHFTGVDVDRRTRTKAIYRIVGPGHKGWSRNVDRELGNYDYLLGADIDHRHRAVKQDLCEWGSWIVQTTGASGFRLDAIKHIDFHFLQTFLQHVRQQTGNSRLFVVGECWSTNCKAFLSYIKVFRGAMAFFDVPLHYNFHNASRQRSGYDLTRIFNDTLVNIKPYDAVTFVDNHEFYGTWSKFVVFLIDDLEHLSQVEGQTLESWVGNHFKIQAYALILLRGQGHPCVFYGDLYPNQDCYDENIAQNVKLLIEARKKYAYGRTIDYFLYKNCIGFVRSGDDTRPGCAVVLSNLEGESGTLVHTIRMSVGKRYAGSTFCGFLQSDGQVIIDRDGWGEFTCLANHVQVWVSST